MSIPDGDTTRLPQGRLLALCGVITALCLGLWVTSGPVQQASATNFCYEVTLQPFGLNGDRCDAGQGSWGHLITAGIQTHERAGCVNYHGWYGEYYRSWACVGTNTSTFIYGPNDGGSYIPIIRNNNQTYAGRFGGSYQCCW